MNKKKWLQRALLLVLAVGACIAIVALTVQAKKPAPKAATAIEARLELAAGEVTVDQGSGPERAVSGTPIHADARVTTGKGARALVRLPDGSSTFLRGGSAIHIGADELALESGEYWLDAPPAERKPLVHRAGDITLTAAEAGLSFRRDGARVTVYVARGRAVVSSGSGRVEVNAGERAVVEGDKSEVAPLAFWEDWTGGMADFTALGGAIGEGAGTIYGVDVGASAGASAQKLQVSRQVVRAVVREGLAETEVDQTFFNPGERPVEGWYWFTLPERATVTGFAVETNGQLVEGEFVERREAAQKYGEAKQTGHAPALLEWVDSQSYRARIFPVPASGARRVVLRYIELGPIVDGKLRYVYPMGRGEPTRIGEFSLSVDLGESGKKTQTATLADARIEDGGRLVTMRRSGYTPRADFQLESSVTEVRPPLVLSRFRADGESADYVMARYVPDVDWTKIPEARADVVVVVDTSAAGDEASRQLKTATAEAILRALSEDDRFALVSLDVGPTVLHPDKELAAASDTEIATALERLAEHSAGGATDLASFFEVALERVHGAEQPAVVYVGDGVATSGEMTGEQLVERLRRALSTSRARLFTVGVGPESDHALLRELARAGGGEALRVDGAGETTERALELAAALKVPTITDFELDLGAGLDEPFYSAAGKISRGSELVVLARSHHDVPDKVKVRGRLGGQAFEKEYQVKKDTSVLTTFVPKLWAAEYVRRLLGASAGPDSERGRIAALGMEYGLMTPFTSVLALESEAAYGRMGIPRRSSRLRGVRLSALEPEDERRIERVLSAGPIPASGFGCSRDKGGSAARDEEPAAKAAATGQARADNKEGGSGTRANEQAPGGAAAPGEQSETPRSEPARPTSAATAYAQASSAPGDPLGDRTRDTEKAGSGQDAPRPPPPAATAGVPLRPQAPPAQPHGGEADDKQKGAQEVDIGGLVTKPPLLAAPKVWQPDLATCSDAAARPLAERVLLWRKRLATATSAEELLQRYTAAMRACELNDWQAERTFLELLQERIKTASDATIVLGRFAGRPDVQKFIAKLILRRAVDPLLVAAVERVVFGGTDWNRVDIALSEIGKPEDRLTKLREAVAKNPDDPNGSIRLVRVLIKLGQMDEALGIGRRLRDRGLLTPRLAAELGDLLTRSGHEAEAQRVYSEIVEFDPQNLDSRRLLGDIYLGHGWYAAAYRQFLTTTELAPDDALGWLRLAAAAAGAGRVDEALRLERRVAGAQGSPGPNDPRLWARLASAARLARLLADPPKGAGESLEAIKRKLKELQLFRGPATLVLVTWENLANDFAIVTKAGDKPESAGEATDAAPAGLWADLLSTSDAARLGFVARLRSAPRGDAVGLVRHDITWDGKDFKVTVRRVELAAEKLDVTL
ncbi:MAG: FecR domain-containing protein [Polyangiaceae bacterium]|nr:FecR domain-containing protein [Polyangiaceae bacterium]